MQPAVPDPTGADPTGADRAGVGLAEFGLPSDGGRRRTRVRRLVRVSAVVALAGLAVLLITQGYLLWSTRDWRYKAVEQVPPVPVALVLGASVTPDRTPSVMLARRLDLAVALYRRGTVRAIVVSGDNGSRRYDEVTAMIGYLRGHDVPAARIVGDYAGFDTWDSCTRAHRIFGVNQAVVLTQQFHLPRAVALCRRAGITAYGLGDDTAHDMPGITRRLELRELFAGVKATWTLLSRPDPRYLGPHETGVDHALATTP